VRAIYVAQAAGLTGILAVVWILKVFVSPTTLAEPISVVILVVLVPILSVTLWPTEIPAWLWVASFGTSVAGTTAGIHFGGGVDQVSGPLLYCVILGLAGLILSPRAAFVVAAWSVAAYACLVWLEYEGWLPHRVAYSRPPDRQLATVIMVGICLFIFASLVSYTVRQIRRTYRRAEDLRREAVSALSSSLKTPLAMIRDAVGSIKAEPAKPSVANDPAVLRIESSAQEAIDLVHNVLDASAIEQAGITPRREPVELDGLLTHIVDLYRPSADLRRMRLVTDLARELPPVSLDVALFGRALGNVLSAALGATRPGENVLISSGRSERGPFVAVCCERAVSPTGEPGLRLARSILEAHGASLETLLDGKGRAVIRLALPTAEETVDSLASRTSIRGQRTTSARCERL
jgi:signal transduction histidine kinase